MMIQLAISSLIFLLKPLMSSENNVIPLSHVLIIFSGRCLIRNQQKLIYFKYGDNGMLTYYTRELIDTSEILPRISIYLNANVQEPLNNCFQTFAWEKMFSDKFRIYPLVRNEFMMKIINGLLYVCYIDLSKKSNVFNWVKVISDSDLINKSVQLQNCDPDLLKSIEKAISSKIIDLSSLNASVEELITLFDRKLTSDKIAALIRISSFCSSEIAVQHYFNNERNEMRFFIKILKVDFLKMFRENDNLTWSLFKEGFLSNCRIYYNDEDFNEKIVPILEILSFDYIRTSSSDIFFTQETLNYIQGVCITLLDAAFVNKDDYSFLLTIKNEFVRLLKSRHFDNISPTSEKIIFPENNQGSYISLLDTCEKLWTTQRYQENNRHFNQFKLLSENIVIFILVPLIITLAFKIFFQYS